MAITEGSFATSDGVRLHYQKTGEGTPSLVIPNGIVYGSDFARLAGPRTVLAYDVRNRGRSDRCLSGARSVCCQSA